MSDDIENNIENDIIWAGVLQTANSSFHVDDYLRKEIIDLRKRVKTL